MIGHFGGWCGQAETMKLRTFDGRLRDAELSVTYPVAPEGLDVTLIAVQDITDRLCTEAQLRRLEADFSRAARISGRNRHPDRAGRARRAARRSGRLASLRPPDRSAQHHTHPIAGKMPGAEPAGKRLAVHARQLALEPNLQILRRHRRPLLRRLEQAYRSALADHVHRTARMGLCVMISDAWYNQTVRALP